MERTHSTIRVPKTAELVADRLRRQIIRGELREGDSLPPEADLMAAYGISRPTLPRGLPGARERGPHRCAPRLARRRARCVPTEEVVARYAGLVLGQKGATIADVSVAWAILEADAAAVIARRARSGGR